jgi:ribokinase
VRCAVVGHIEWIEFARVEAMPMARLAGGCVFFTSLGDDEIGRESKRRLTELGLTMEVQGAGQPTRRAWTHVDGAGERTITLLSEKLLPRGPLPLDDFDCVFFVAGDVAALRSARRAPFVAATTREQPTLLEAQVPVDLLVGSMNDAGETYEGGVEARTIVLTDGSRGGLADGKRYRAAQPPGPIEDAYGAGDSFSAALCFALARGDSLDDALDLAARAGAYVITGRGPYSRQLSS